MPVEIAIRPEESETVPESPAEEQFAPRSRAGEALIRTLGFLSTRMH